MITNFLLLIFGLFLLVKGSIVLIDISSVLAKKIGFSDFFIGAVILGFGTSVPELFIAINSGFLHISNLSLGNVIGSSINTMLLAVGIAAIISPIYFKKEIIESELPKIIFFIILLSLLINNFFITAPAHLSRLDGLILLLLFLFYFYRDSGKNINASKEIKKSIPPLSDIVYLIISLAALLIGASIVTSNAEKISTVLQINSGLIGLIVIALGTTLPEISTSIIAAIKKNGQLAMGNIIGSMIFNLSFIVGVGVIINPYSVDSSMNLALILCLLLSFGFYFFAANGDKKKHISQLEGVLLLTCYIFYLSYFFISN